MKRYVFRLLALLVALPIAVVMLLAIYGTLTKEIARNSLTDDDLLATEGLPNIYRNLRVVSYNFNGGSQLSEANRGALVIVSGQNDMVFFKGIVKEGDTLGITGYEVIIRRIKPGLLPTSRGYMILRFRELNQP